MTPFEMIEKNDFEGLKDYLGFNQVNIINEKEESLLHLAIKLNLLEIFNYLINEGINLNQIDCNGFSPLMLCIQYNKMNFFKKLIKSNANVNIINQKGESALFLASRLNRIEALEILITLPIDYDPINCYGENFYFQMIKSRNLDNVKRFFRQEYLSIQDKKGNTPLHLAVKINDLEITTFLLEKGAYTNALNSLRETPIFEAVRHKNVDIIEQLLLKGALLEYCNQDFLFSWDEIEEEDFQEYLKSKLDAPKYKEYKKKYPLHYYVQLGNSIEASHFLTIVYLKQKDSFGFLASEYAKKQGNKIAQSFFRNDRG